MSANLQQMQKLLLHIVVKIIRITPKLIHYCHCRFTDGLKCLVILETMRAHPDAMKCLFVASTGTEVHTKHMMELFRPDRRVEDSM